MKKNAIIILATNKYLPLGLRLISKIYRHYKNIDNLDIHLVTDINISDKIKYENIIFHNKIAETWNLSTILKLDMCKNICEEYDYGYIGCLDSDTNIYRDFNEDEIFSESFVMESAWARNTPLSQHYESNKKSSAYVDPSEYGKIYYQTCYFGGDKEHMLEMVNLAIDLRTIDFNNNIIAKWTDEAYLQKYFLKNAPKKVFDPFNQKIFPFKIDDKGSGNFVSGKHQKPFYALSDDKYQKMLNDIYILLEEKNYNWDIINNQIVFDNN